MKETLKICLTCSAGGHLHQLRLAIKDLNINADFYWVLYKTKHTSKLMEDKKHYFITNLESHKRITYLKNFIQSFFILLKEKPQVIISTGAGVSVPTLFLGKKLFNAKVIYICSAANVTEPSRTPVWAYKYSDLFLIQWEEMQQLFPKAINIGVL